MVSFNSRDIALLGFPREQTSLLFLNDIPGNVSTVNSIDEIAQTLSRPDAVAIIHTSALFDEGGQPMQAYAQFDALPPSIKARIGVVGKLAQDADFNEEGLGYIDFCDSHKALSDFIRNTIRHAFPSPKVVSLISDPARTTTREGKEEILFVGFSDVEREALKQGLDRNTYFITTRDNFGSAKGYLKEKSDTSHIMMIAKVEGEHFAVRSKHRKEVMALLGSEHCPDFAIYSDRPVNQILLGINDQAKQHGHFTNLPFNDFAENITGYIQKAFSHKHLLAQGLATNHSAIGAPPKNAKAASRGLRVIKGDREAPAASTGNTR